MLDATSGTVTLYGAFGLLYENKLPCSVRLPLLPIVLTPYSHPPLSLQYLLASEADRVCG